MAGIVPQRINRSEAIDMLRAELLTRIGDDDQSACKLSAELGIFCRGFARFSDAEFRERYDWIVRRRPYLSRTELEDIADRWQLARQEVSELPIPCDVQQKAPDTCRGWDDFSNEDLAYFIMEMCGKSVIVVAPPAP